MILWWLALNSYPQTYPQAPVDDATHRPQSLTECQDPSLYLKDNILKIKINKKKINIKLKTNKNLLAIPMSILILTISTTTEAKAVSQTDLLKLYAHSRIINYEQFSCFNALITKGAELTMHEWFAQCSGCGAFSVKLVDDSLVAGLE